ncbi:MAG TPA: PAS domain-containing protein, partial [Pseudobdellovibrionaceae bacterium]|nr:PAS domain-containing protein [Pseudobdellovibrionaceae bacterium]
KVLGKDMAFRAAVSAFEKAGEIRKINDTTQAKLEEGTRLYLAGLMEILNIKNSIQDLRYAMITDAKGLVLAHTDQTKIGLHLSDDKSLSYMKKLETTMIVDDDQVVDYASPILVENKPIGWSRISLSKANSNLEILSILKEGILYTIFAILLGWFFAYRLGQYLTEGLDSLMSITTKFSRGERALRANVSGIIELEVLSTGINEMLNEIQKETAALSSSEMALKKSEERYYLALKGADEGLWDWDLITNEVYFCDRWKSMIGYSSTEIENRFEEWKKLLNVEDLQYALDKIEGLVKSKNEFSFRTEFRMRHKEGHYVWILSRGFLLRNKEGVPV